MAPHCVFWENSSPTALFTMTPTISYTTQLKTLMQKLRPPFTHQQQQKSHINPDLHTSTFVFAHHDAVKKSLQPPYDGPFQSSETAWQTLYTGHYGKRKVISLNRLKPAYIEDVSIIDSSPHPDLPLQQDAATNKPSQPPTTPSNTPPTTTSYKTRSDRHVHWPNKRLFDYRTFTWQFIGGGVL